MVTGDNGAGAGCLQIFGRRKHETHSRRCPGVALAHVRGMGHYALRDGAYYGDRGDTDLVFLEMFKTDWYQEFSFAEWLAHTPSELVMAHLNIDKATYDAFPKNGIGIVPS
jgi:hypothetical protein